MPKYVGSTIPDGSRRIEDNVEGGTYDLVRLKHNQMRLLPAICVMRSMDTSDKGSSGTLAKRWYRWFASSSDILANPKSTPNMRARALRASTK